MEKIHLLKGGQIERTVVLLVATPEVLNKKLETEHKPTLWQVLYLRYMVNGYIFPSSSHSYSAFKLENYILNATQVHVSDETSLID